MKNKENSKLNGLENQRIDAKKIYGGRKQTSSEFVNSIDQMPAGKSGSGEMQISKRNLLNKKK